jgi:hypothetical protein
MRMLPFQVFEAADEVNNKIKEVEMMKYRCDKCGKNCIIEQMDGTPPPTACPSSQKGWKELVFWLRIEL